MTINQLIREDLLDLQKYTSARSESGNFEGAFLDANESPYGEFRLYPDPDQNRLKERLAEIKKVDKEKLILTNGSDELIDLCIRLACKSGDRILQFTPTYGMYEITAKIQGVHTDDFQTQLDGSFDWDAFETQLTEHNYKMLFICSPNNPLGFAYSLKAIERIAQTFNGLIYLDEAYVEFSAVGSTVNLTKRYPNLLIGQTLSKAYGMAGLRIGIGLADSNIIEWLRKIKPPYNLSTVAQQSALSQLENIGELQQNIKEIKRERDELYEALKVCACIQNVFPSQANFLLIECSSADVIQQKLKDRGLLVRNRGKQIPNTLRISIGSPLQNKLLIEILQNIAS